MRSTARPPALQGALLVALAMHGAIAAGLLSRTVGLPGRDGAPPPAHQGHSSVQFRLVSSPALPLSDEGRHAPNEASPLAQALDTPQVDTPPVATPAPTDAEATVALHGEQGDEALQGYFGREDLDQGPKALSRVQIAYPPGVPDNELQAGRLTLFIDEHGSVRRILVLDQSLPPPFQEAARNAFLQTRFAPAERAGRIVRSRIDVEVVFDARASRMVGARRTDAPT